MVDKGIVCGQKVGVFHKDGSLIGVTLVENDSNTLLSYLEKKDLYQTDLGKMAEVRKKEWLAVRVLLKEILNEEKIIRYLPSGKPYLEDGSFNISISHTKGYAAIILDKQNKVAIDIEQISPRVNTIRSRFMNEVEEKNLSKERELIHLLLHWSAKESLYKFLDDEKIEFKTQLIIKAFEPKINEWSEFSAIAKGLNYTTHYYVNDDYVLTYLST
jgi:Phosphopantetheinyl transferase